MSIPEALMLGLIQGVTEWLPVSSSGHLALYQQFAGIDVPLVFNILLHFASLGVILTVFRKRIAEILRSFHKNGDEENGFRYLRNIAIGTLPIAVCGFLFRDFVETAFSNTFIIALGLIATGVLLFLSRFGKQICKKVTGRSSLIMGAAQAIALIPGISRSGMTISAGILSGTDREKAAEFSFMLAIPAICGATLLEISRVGSIRESLVLPLVIGMIVSFAVGYLSLKLLLKVVKRGNLFWFSPYCIILGLLLLYRI